MSRKAFFKLFFEHLMKSEFWNLSRVLRSFCSKKLFLSRVLESLGFPCFCISALKIFSQFSKFDRVLNLSRLLQSFDEKVGFLFQIHDLPVHFFVFRLETYRTPLWANL
ncbi:hypothetical protein Bealeia1_01969 (plasmid) [Candidatus Bealeia paramacronuclearis]|uniref:Uncharacterized protein n=1 Tax=Candidatus Bealeia paramacronuclearis TaxID=1921001 RepID=A0ABZ2C5M7_9PROT